jgi:opacity protein-like surface antigen
MPLMLRSLFAGAALLLASMTGAGAADLGGAAPGYDHAPAAYGRTASWYVRGDFSYAWMDANKLWSPNFTFDTVSVDNTWGLGGGIGAYFGRGFRGDITYEWRAGTDVHGSSPIAVTDFELKSQVLLANLYYDFRPGERFTPYVGIGLGAARHSTSSGTVTLVCGGTCNFDGDKKWTPAAALMAGLSFRFDRHAQVSIKDSEYTATSPGRLHLDVGYRFLYLGDAETGFDVGPGPVTPGPHLEDIMAHEIRVGLRYDF